MHMCSENKLCTLNVFSPLGEKRGANAPGTDSLVVPPPASSSSPLVIFLKERLAALTGIFPRHFEGQTPKRADLRPAGNHTKSRCTPEATLGNGAPSKKHENGAGVQCDTFSFGDVFHFSSLKGAFCTACKWHKRLH